MRKLVFGLIVALGVSFFPAGARAETVSDEAAFVAKINDLRASKGLAPLQVNANLVAKARAWSAGMADAGRIWHSTLSDGVNENWRKLGENVGMGGSVDGLHNAFVNSPHHYENLIDPAFGYVGIGIVMNGNTIFVSEVFMQLMPSTTTTTAPPATTSTTAKPVAPKPLIATARKPTAPKPVLTPVKPPAPASTTTSTTTTTTAPPVIPPVAPPVPEVHTAPVDPPRAPSPLLVSVLERLRTFNS